MSEHISYDHRSSIADFTKARAEKYEGIGRREEASILRALAQDIKSEIDIESGKRGIGTPAHAVAFAVCNRFRGVDVREVFGPSVNRAVVRARFAAMWIVRKRFGWTYDCIGAHFDREESSVRDALKRADEMRDPNHKDFDAGFKSVTDDLSVEPIRCQHCNESLLLA